MIKSACCWQWPVNPHNSTSIRQKKERRTSTANPRPLNGNLCAGRCRAQAYSPHASAAQSGTEKAGCTHPSRKRRRGSARYNNPAHSGRRAGRKKRAEHDAERKTYRQGRTPKGQHGIFCFKEKDAVSSGDEKSPHRLAAAGVWRCLIPVPAKGQNRPNPLPYRADSPSSSSIRRRRLYLYHTVGTAQRAGFDLSGVGSYGNVRDGGVLRFSGTVGNNGGIAVAHTSSTASSVSVSEPI